MKNMNKNRANKDLYFMSWSVSKLIKTETKLNIDS